MAITLPKIEALHTVAASSFGGAVDGGGNTFIAANDYYWSSVASGGSVSLLSAWQTLLAAVIGGTTVTLDDATGQITVTWGSGTHTFTWANTTARDRFGWTGNLSPAGASFVGQKQAKGVWLPNMPPTDLRSSVATQGARVSDKRVTRAPSGAVWTTRWNEWYEQTLRFVALTKAKTWAGDESLGNESAEQFWADCLVKGTPIRYHKDRAVDGTHFSYDSLLTSFEPTVRRRGWEGAWDWEIPCTSYVHVATGGGF